LKVRVLIFFFLPFLLTEYPSTTEPPSTTATEQSTVQSSLETTTTTQIPTTEPQYIPPPVTEVITPILPSAPPFVANVYPTFGPRSGGTKVTVTGDNLNIQTVSHMSLGNILCPLDMAQR
jgi:hypothetical protein